MKSIVLGMFINAIGLCILFYDHSTLFGMSIIYFAIAFVLLSAVGFIDADIHRTMIGAFSLFFVASIIMFTLSQKPVKNAIPGRFG